MNSLSDLLNSNKDAFNLPKLSPIIDEKPKETPVFFDPEETMPKTTAPEASTPLPQAVSDDNTDRTLTTAPREEEVLDEAPQALDIDQMKKTIHAIKDQLDGMLRLLQGEEIQIKKATEPDVIHAETGERIVEGVFNGEKMIGPDGAEYTMSPNYASKSKLVEGDLMKLTITKNGSFIYKQIGPIDRKRITGELVYDTMSGHWNVVADGKPYRVLTASVTFYKGKAGDEAVILVPQEGSSMWGAVETILNA